MPIGVQIITPKWEDEKCLAAMKILEEEIQFKKPLTF